MPLNEDSPTSRPGGRCHLWQLAPEPQAAGLARRFVADLLACSDLGSLRYDAQLVVSELITNAARSAEQLSLTVALYAPDEVRIVVWSDRPGAPEVQELDDFGESGRGLHIVAACATEWAHGPGPGGVGTVVFARLAGKAGEGNRGAGQ